MPFWHARYLLIIVLSASQLSACASDDWLRFYGGCERPSDAIRLLGSPLNASDIDAKSFGALVDRWHTLRRSMQPGDELYRFWGEEINPGYGYRWNGYAVVRRGCIVSTLTTETISFG
jgi:hypothetical protein